MIKTIFFDIDDTLYDHSYHLAQGIAALRAEYAFLHDHSQESLESLSQRLLEEAHLQLLAGEVTFEESRQIRWRKFVKETGGAESEAARAAEMYSKAYYQAERATPGSIQLLQSLKQKYSLGVISNNLFEEQLKKMHRIGVGEDFDMFAISEEVGYAKPHPRIFEIALERAGVRPDEAILIGDSWTNDILGAQQSGIRPIWFNRKRLPSQDTSVAEISSFESVEEIVDVIQREAKNLAFQAN